MHVPLKCVKSNFPFLDVFYEHAPDANLLVTTVCVNHACTIMTFTRLLFFNHAVSLLVFASNVKCVIKLKF
jgi:hypothetical protein